MRPSPTPFRHSLVLLAAFLPALAAGVTAAAQEVDPAPAVPAVGRADSAKHIAVSAEVTPAQVPAGGRAELLVKLEVGPGWHTYPDPAQNELSISALNLKELAGIAPGAVAWPAGVEDEHGEKIYEGTVVLRVPFTVAADAVPGPRTIAGDFFGQACSDQCLRPSTIPFAAKFTVLPATGDAVPPPPAPAPPLPGEVKPAPAPPPAPPAAAPTAPVAEDPWILRVQDQGLDFELNLHRWPDQALFVLLCLFGGLIMNFMPCVLPIIPLKISGLAHAAGSRRRTFLLGVVMSAGVVVSWLAVGLVVALLAKSSSQLLSPWWVRVGLGVFIAAMAFMACGLFNLRLPQFLYAIQPRHDTVRGAFGFGVMTGVFALPCTAPIMGTVSGFAAKVGSPALVLLVFTLLGLGMALPYLVLTAQPAWVSKLPRSGPASDLMKNVLGLMMLAGGAYFVGAGLTTLANPVSEWGNQLFWFPVYLLALASGLVLAFGCARLTADERGIRPGRLVFFVFGLLLAWLALDLGLAKYRDIRLQMAPPQSHNGGLPETVRWQMIGAESELPLGQGVVVVDFISDICPNCEALERRVFLSEAGRRVLNAPDVRTVRLNVDRSKEAEAWLYQREKQQGPPFVIVFDAKGGRHLATSAPTAAQLEAAIVKARAAK